MTVSSGKKLRKEEMAFYSVNTESKIFELYRVFGQISVFVFLKSSSVYKNESYSHCASVYNDIKTNFWPPIPVNFSIL